MIGISLRWSSYFPIKCNESSPFPALNQHTCAVVNLRIYFCMSRNYCAGVTLCIYGEPTDNNKSCLEIWGPPLMFIHLNFETFWSPLCDSRSTISPLAGTKHLCEMRFLRSKGTGRRHYFTIFRSKSENESLLMNASFSDKCVYCHFLYSLCQSFCIRVRL